MTVFTFIEPKLRGKSKDEPSIRSNGKEDSISTVKLRSGEAKKDGNSISINLRNESNAMKEKSVSIRVHNENNLQGKPSVLFIDIDINLFCEFSSRNTKC